MELRIKKDFDEVLFSNTVSFKSKFKKEDVCQNCMIPLYDEIYVLTEDGKTGFPQCPACTHEYIMPRGYKIVRQTAKLSRNDVIKAIPDNIFVNEKYKQVLLSINNINFHKFESEGYLMYVDEETKTVGLNTSLGSLIHNRKKIIKFLGWTPKFIFKYTLINE